MAWSFDGKSPVSLQIARKLRIDILKGAYPAGTQFPTVRQLACDASVNPNTMQKALAILENEGILISKTTVGRFVTEDKEVLDEALASLQKEYLESAISGATELGITRDGILKFLKEREDLL